MEGGAPSPTDRGLEAGIYLRVQVTDLDTGAAKVNVTIPIGLVSAGLRIAERFAPEFDGFDMQEMEDLLASGMTGKMVEVVDEAGLEQITKGESEAG